MARGVEDVLESVIRDLRDHGPLVDQLPEAEAVYQARPSDDPNYPVALVLMPIYEGGQPHRGAVTRSYRVQAAVTSTATWREQTDAEDGTTATTAMFGILDAAADVLDTSAGDGVEVPEGSEGGPTPQSVPAEQGGGRLRIQSDWILNGTYPTE